MSLTDGEKAIIAAINKLGRKIGDVDGDDTDARDNAEAAQQLRDTYAKSTSEDEINKLLAKRLELLDEEHSKLSGIGQLITGQASVFEKSLAVARERAAAAAREVEIHQKEAQRQLEIESRTSGIIKTNATARRKAAEESLKAAKQQINLNKALKESKKLGESLGKSFGKLVTEGASLKDVLSPKNLSAGFKALKPLLSSGWVGFAGLAGAAGMFAASLAAAVGPAVLGSLLAKMKDLVFLLVDAENAFRKATGASAEFARDITRNYEATRQYGIQVGDLSKANSQLYNTFTDFTTVVPTTRDELSKTGAVLEKLGVSNQDYARSIQNTTKMFGVAANQADDVMLGIAAHAADIGVAPGVLGAKYASMTPKLAKLGSTGEKAFKDLAIASKITGMEMEKILNMTDKFDTFEGAATQAGKLNAALGGNFVNAMELMTATDPVERFEMIRDSILDTGLSFDSMSYYQRKFFADSAGLDNVGDLALMLAGDMKSLDSEIGKTSADYEDAAKRAMAFSTIQEKISALFASFIPIITPAIDMLNNLMNSMSENQKIIKPLVAAFLYLAGAIMTVVGVVMLFTGLGTATGGMLAASGSALMFSGALIGLGKDAGKLFTALSDATIEVFGPFIDLMKEMWTTVKLLDEEFGLFSHIIGITVFYFKALLHIGKFVVKVLYLPLLTVATMLTRVFKLLNAALKGEIDGFQMLGGILFEYIITPFRIIASAIQVLGALIGQDWNLNEFIDDLLKLGFTLFKKAYASSFLDGLGKIAVAFDIIGEAISLTLLPFKMLIKALGTLGGVMFSKLKPGLGKIAVAFDIIGEAIKRTNQIMLLPLKMLIKSFAMLGDVMFPKFQPGLGKIAAAFDTISEAIKRTNQIMLLPFKMLIESFDIVGEMISLALLPLKMLIKSFAMLGDVMPAPGTLGFSIMHKAAALTMGTPSTTAAPALTMGPPSTAAAPATASALNISTVERVVASTVTNTVKEISTNNNNNNQQPTVVNLQIAGIDVKRFFQGEAIEVLEEVGKKALMGYY
jgi:hypothetical protein